MASQISKRARFGPLSASEVDPSAASSSTASHPSSPPPSDSNSLSASRNSRSNETTWGGDLMPTGESAQMAAAGGVRMPTVGVDQKPTREIDQMSVVGGSQPQGDSAAHDELQERCFACDGDHSLLHCDVKFSMCQASGMYGMSTEKPFHYVDCPKEIRDIIQDPLAKPMIRAWFKVFNVPDADVTRSWRELFHCASQVGLLVDVDIGTLDGNRSDCIRMLIDLVSTNGAPFVATVSYGPCHRKVRFELEVSQGEVKGCREAS